MKVLVTGGTGFVGCHTVSALIRDGHQVRLFVRSPERVRPALGPLGIEEELETETGDVTDEEAVRRALQGCEAVVHCAAVYNLSPKKIQEVRRTNVRGAEVVLGTAERLGLDPIVHVSSLVALLGPRGATITADSEPSPTEGEYARSKAESDGVARRLQEKGAPVVITYPSSVWGPHDPHFGESSLLIKTILKGGMPFVLPGGYPVCDVRDVARLHAAVLVPGRGPRRYLVPSHNLKLTDFFVVLSQVTGRNLSAWTLPVPVARCYGWCADRIARLVPGLRGGDYQGVLVVERANRYDDSPTRTELALEPLPVARIAADTVRWMVEAGHLPPRLAGTLAADTAGRRAG